jgi:hypothetical protein
VEILPGVYVFHILGLDNILAVLLDIVLDIPAGVDTGLDRVVVLAVLLDIVLEAVLDILDTLLGVVPDMAAVVVEKLGTGLVLDIPIGSPGADTVLVELVVLVPLGAVPVLVLVRIAVIASVWCPV